MVLWVRSYWHDELLLLSDYHYEHTMLKSSRWGIGCSHGSIYCVHHWMPPMVVFDGPDEQHALRLIHDESATNYPPLHTCHFAGFVAGSQEPVIQAGLTEGQTLVGMPGWFVALLFLVLPGSWVLFRTRYRQKSAGLCPSCGYDLRATPGRCPECNWRGAEPDAK